MKLIITLILLFLMVFAIVLGITLAQNSKSEDSNIYESIGVNKHTEDHSLKLHTTIPYWDQPSAINSLLENISLFETVSLYWYYIDTQGNITKYQSAIEDLGFVRKAQDEKVKVLGLIANLPDSEGDWDYRRVDKVIATASARKAHIKDIIELIERNNFDGINIDYENLRRSQRQDFSSFIEELAEELHSRSKILGVAVHPKSGENISSESNGSQAQDWSTLFTYADQLYFMTFDEHNVDTPAGPIGSIDWINDVLNYADTFETDKSNIYLGIPMYGYDWDGNGNAKGREYDEIQKIIDDYSPSIEFDETIGEPHFTYDYGDQTTHTVWYNNERSIQMKSEIAKKRGLGGITFWRFGREDPNVWEVIRSYL